MDAHGPSTPSNHPQRTHSWCITPDRWQPNLFYKTASAIPLVMLQGFFLCICIFSYEQEMLLKCFKMSSINLSSSSLRLFFLIAWKIDDSFSSLKHPWCICKLLPQHLYTKQPITFQFPSDFFGDTQLCLLISCQLPPLGSKDLFYCFWGIAALSSWFFYTVLGFWSCTMPRSIRASAWQLMQRDYAPFCSCIPVHLFYSPPV